MNILILVRCVELEQEKTFFLDDVRIKRLSERYDIKTIFEDPNPTFYSSFKTKIDYCVTKSDERILLPANSQRA